MAFALQSLVQILEQDQHHLFLDTRPKIESFLEKAGSLRNLVETTSVAIIEDLNSRIRDVVHEAEDIIESHIAVQLVPVSEEDEADNELELTYVMEEFDSIKNQILLNMEDSRKAQVDLLLTQLPPDISSSLMWDPKYSSRVWGFNRDIRRLKNQLTGQKSQLQVIPIVGIGGSGKTTLAQSLYQYRSIVSHFDCRAWTTISQEFNLRLTLLSLLDCLIMATDEMRWETDDQQLGKYVHANLVNKRYLIVVDDIWHTNAYDELRKFFPDNHNGSRIILTTREWNMAEYAKTSIYPHQMLPMNDEQSWHLLCQKVFGDGYNCPHELVETGRKIARNCRGHPLTIVTMAGFLSATDYKQKDWQHVESHQLHSTDVRGEVDSITEKMSKIQVDPSLKGFVEYFAKDGLQLMSQLMQGQSKLQIIPIVRMGESNGNATLAQLLYNRALSAQHFDTNAWVKIKETEMMGSKQRNLLATLQGLLDSLDKCAMTHVNDDDVAVRLHKTLKKRRYLIVVDDIRDAHTWDNMSRFFPDEGNGSRIILTAREWSHYDGINPFCLNSYWEFLLGKVANFLPTSEKTLEFWKLVEEEHVSSAKSNRDLNLDLLSMSYNNLPYHLKPCFLYVGAFPEDLEIQATHIIHLWIAEGFVSTIAENSLEDTASMYLEDLISRYFLSACKKDVDGKARTFKIHDVFWKFCQKKALEEKFMWFKDLNGHNIPEDGEIGRRVSVHPMSRPIDDEYEVMSFARTFLCIGPASLDLAPIVLVLRLLRVLDVFGLRIDQFPEAILTLVNLRYVALTCYSDLPSSISIFRNLQTLVTSEVLSLPSELWEMTQLRFIECPETCIWNTSGKGESFHHEELHTLINIPASEVTHEFLRHNPNIKTMVIIFNASTHAFLPLDCLKNLEVLMCSSVRSKTQHDFLHDLRFPASLRKLNLSSCIIHSEFMTTYVGSLPFLESLDLQKCDLVDLLWKPAEGGFPRLRVLLMEDLNLVHWKAKRTHFPDLQHLFIRGCHAMEGIHSSMGYIPTLKSIEVDQNCSRSVHTSAKIIQEEQMNLGNDLLRVIFHGSAEYRKPSPAKNVAESSRCTPERELAMRKPEKLLGEESYHIERQNSTVLMADEAEAKGYAAFSTGNFADAIRHYTDAINLHPSDHLLYFNRSEAHASVNQFSKALSDAQKTVQLKPDWSEGYACLGSAYLGLENYKNAVSAYKKGLEIDPINEDLKFQLSYAKGGVAISTRNFADAILHCTDAINLRPSYHFLYSNRSLVHAGLNQFSEALSDAQKSVQLKPDWSRGYLNLGNAYLGLDNYKDAISAYKKGLKIDPSDNFLKFRLFYSKLRNLLCCTIL